jgi:transcriptional regulator with XRE-family HTH domain
MTCHFNFGITLRHFMELQNVTPSELARKMDITPQQVNTWRNSLSVTTTTLMLVCAALKVKPTEFVNVGLQVSIDSI